MSSAFGSVAAAAASASAYTTTALASTSYTAPGSYTWTKPACSFVLVICCGPGGGGGSGSSGAGNPGTGGGGGGGGGRAERLFRASDLPSTVTVVVPSGGAGGAGVITAAGNPGGAASGPATFGATTDPWYVVGYQGGAGANGAGGANAGSGAGGSPVGAGAAGSGASAGVATPGASSGVATGSSTASVSGGSGGGAGANGTFGGTSGAANGGSSGGGGGAGISGGNTVYMGGSAGGVVLGYTTVLGGGTAGANQSPPFPAPPGGTFNGRGGPGGASSITGNSGHGANGASPGGGGGGGAAALTGNKSGSGGDGGDGAVYIITWGSAQTDRDTWITGYYPSWENSNGLLITSKIDFPHLTHVNFFSSIPASNGTLNNNFDINATDGPALAVDVTSRAHAAGKKAMLCVGGFGRSSGFAGASSSANLSTFVSNLIASKNSMGFDGIDIDWEPLPSNMTDYKNLIVALRAADPTMLLTVAVPQVNVNYQTAKPEFAELCGALNRINIMTYDMSHDGAGWYSWHNSPLNGENTNHPTSVSSSVNAYITAGVPAKKLGIGSPFYGAGRNGVTAPGQDTTGSTAVGNDVTLSYKNIKSSYYSPDAYKWDSVARCPYLSFASPTGSVNATYISYENERSILEKTIYVKEKGLGGIIIWTMGEGRLADDSQPLLVAMYNYLMLG